MKSLEFYSDPYLGISFDRERLFGMAEVLAVIGGVSAGLQLISTTTESVLATIKLIQDLKDVPERLALLLSDVNESISRVSPSCSLSVKNLPCLSPSQNDSLSRYIKMLHSALEDIQATLMPLFTTRGGRRGSVLRFWTSFVSIKVEKELSRRLERLNRLNIEVVRELGEIGVEMHATTHGLITSGNTAITQGVSSIEAKIDLLRNEFQTFTVSVPRTQVMAENRVSALVCTQPTTNRQMSDSVSESSEPASPSNCQALQEQEFLSLEKAEQMRRYLAAKAEVGITPGRDTVSTTQLPDAKLEFVLFGIRSFYTTGNFDAATTTLVTKFWQETELGIYLAKVTKGKDRGASQSQIRSLQLLRKATAVSVGDTLPKGTASILIELLSTLSPVNTSACPDVRHSVLRYLGAQAQAQLSPGHPITLVINKLKDDNSDINVSTRALTFIADRLRATFGPANELTFFATERLCAVLRRSGQYTEVIRVIREGIRAIRALLGPASVQERKLFRQLEHVYMDQKDWPAALSTCFDIVGQQQLEPPDPDPLYHDECSVWTMADIAKTCECAGNLDQAVAWLKQARISSGMLWGQSDMLSHIQDKLNELLKLLGREDELELWNEPYYP